MPDTSNNRLLLLNGMKCNSNETTEQQYEQFVYDIRVELLEKWKYIRLNVVKNWSKTIQYGNGLHAVYNIGEKYGVGLDWTKFSLTQHRFVFINVHELSK